MNLTKINHSHPAIRIYNSVTEVSPRYDPNPSPPNHPQQQQEALSLPTRFKSFNTIDITFNRLPKNNLASGPSTRDVCKSNSGSKEGSNNLRSKEGRKEIEVVKRREGKQHLTQVFIEMESQPLQNTCVKKVKQSSTGLQTKVPPKQEYVKHYNKNKRGRQEEIPSFIQVHLLSDRDLLSQSYEKERKLSRNPNQPFREHQSPQLRTKKKTKVLLPPLPNPRKQFSLQPPLQTHINFSPYVTEYKLIEPREKSKQIRVKNQRFLSQQKSRRRVAAKCSLSTLHIDPDICGWQPQQ